MWGKRVIWFLGDVHGRFDHVIRLVQRHCPEAVVFLGDLECSLPLDMIQRPILDQTEIWFIHGNHDSDRPAYWHNLHGCGLAERGLHRRVVEIAGHRIAGLGGTFESQVWRPGSPDTDIQSYSSSSGESMHKALILGDPVFSSESPDFRCNRHMGEC